MASTSDLERQQGLRWQSIGNSLRLEELLDALGIAYTRQGKELAASCPLPSHGGVDRNPSWSVRDEYPYKHNCWSCTGGGTVIGLVMEVRGCSFVEAVDVLCDYGDAKTPSGQELVHRLRAIAAMRPEGGTRRPTLPWFPAEVLDQFDQPTDYFTSRGISEAVCRTLRLGFDAEHQRKDYIGPAAIIPHIFQGEVVGWQERWLDPDRPAAIKKYTNTDDFPKSETLYNFDLAADNHSEVVVVESALTAATLLSAGIYAVATFGGSVAPQQLRLLKGFRRLILAFDNDDAGRSATQMVGAVVSRHVEVVVLPPPPGEKADLGDLSADDIHAIFPTTQPYIIWGS